MRKVHIELVENVMGRSSRVKNRENARVSLQPMSEISKIQLYYILRFYYPSWTYFINDFLPIFGLYDIILWAQRVDIFFKLVSRRSKRGKKLFIK